MSHTKQLRRVFKSLTIVYRGYRGQRQPDGSIVYGDVHYPDLACFMTGIDELAKARFQALSNSIERSENKLK